MEPEIDVLFEPDHEVPTMRGTRPMLTFGRHPVHSHGWTLVYLDDPASPTAGAEEYFIPGDLTDVDAVVAAAKAHLATL